MKKENKEKAAENSGKEINSFQSYRRKGYSEMRPYVKGEDLTGISVSPEDNPEEDMGMVARNPNNHKDQWYVASKYFADNLELVVPDAREVRALEGKPVIEGNLEAARKTLINTDASKAKVNVKDIKFWGDGDTFKLVSKASSVNEGWMKSTKAMEIPGVGCVVQVTTQQGSNVAEAVCFVPGVKIHEVTDEKGTVTSRLLIPR